MIGFIVKMCLLISFVHIEYMKAENNEDISEEFDGEDNSSLNSESLEVFNTSSRENRIEFGDSSEVGKETLLKKVTNTTMLSIESIEKENSITKEVNQSKSELVKKKFPFSVSIQRKSSHYASGALVDKQWVLTAAGEFYNVRESIKLFKARLGSVNCKKGGILVPIKMMEIHPSYVPKKPGYDVALLKLASPVDYTELIAPIAISKTKGRVLSAKFITTYWPRLIIKGQVLPPIAKERFKQNSMRVSPQMMIPREKCEKIMQKNNITLEYSSFCLEPIVSHHTPCMPDPGAPVVAKDGLWGTTSGWTAKDCSNSPTMFTRLSSPKVTSWLQLILVDLLL